jgi:hypothetical protein
MFIPSAFCRFTVLSLVCSSSLLAGEPGQHVEKVPGADVHSGAIMVAVKKIDPKDVDTDTNEFADRIRRLTCRADSRNDLSAFAHSGTVERRS